MLVKSVYPSTVVLGRVIYYAVGVVAFGILLETSVTPRMKVVGDRKIPELGFGETVVEAKPGTEF